MACPIGRINIPFIFGPRERIDGDIKGAIGNDWGRMYVMRKYVEVKSSGSGKGNNFDPGL